MGGYPFSTVCVVGHGRVGSAFASRLLERGIDVRVTGRELGCLDADLVLVCVPDRAIASVAANVVPGPWVAHASGAAQLNALDPHRRRFSVHPLQTIVHKRGPEQLDGAFAAVTAENEEALAAGLALANLLGLKPFELQDSKRPLYHAAAGFVAHFVIALWRAAASMMTQCGAPPEALLPLLHRTIDNDFELTGPISRGDWTTLDRHLEAIRAEQPEIEPMYLALVASFGGDAANWANSTAMRHGPTGAPSSASRPD
jgi:predicted short-subunit dehydrogenase-like oxidoreductase (DUF2520 family)